MKNEDRLLVCTFATVVTVCFFGVRASWKNIDTNECLNRPVTKELEKTLDESHKKLLRRYCECVVEHPVSDIDETDVETKEYNILVKIPEDTCKNRILVF